jgi:hypothetical protein
MDLMPGSFLDFCPPEMQTFYGAAAGGILVVGLFVWGAGIRLARPAVAGLMGVGAAGLALWTLPGATGLAPVSAGVIGFVAGVLAGAVSFRFVQAFVLAACLALVVSGLYYRANILPGRSTGTAQVATLPAKEMLIAPERLGTSAGQTARVDMAMVMDAASAAGAQVQRALVHEWEALNSSQQQRLGILAGLAALAGLLTALFFPRHTTWVGTAALGTVLISASGLALMQVFGRAYLASLPTRPMPMLGILGGVMVVGMIVQRMLFWRGKKKAKPRVEASPVPGSLPGEPVAA